MEERLKYLFQQYLENTCSRKEFEEFFSLIREATFNEELSTLIKKVYDEGGMQHSSGTYVDESGNLVLTEPDWPAPAPVRSKRRKRSLIGASVIASIIIATTLGVLFYKPNLADREKVSTQSLTKKTTERSEYKYLLLPDSTQVWLNAASTLEFPQVFDDDTREVFLSGEAYFDVKHANKIPFIIRTGNISTTVLGTAFNIKAYPGRKNIIVSVSRGKVRVNYDDKEVATLVQGQQVKVNSQDSRIVEKKAAMSEAAAWQRGNMVYDDEPIEDIIADLERIYDVHILVREVAIQRLHVSTSFKREIGIEQALQVLCELTDTRLNQADGLFIIQ